MGKNQTLMKKTGLVLLIVILCITISLLSISLIVKIEWKVRLINFMDTKHIVEINNVLTNGHRRRIGVTPFKWCLELERSLDICSPLLVELLWRWDDGEQSFHIWKHLVPLSVIDVCFSLGLGVVGEEVQFGAYGCGLVGSLFCGERICIKGITNMIRSVIGTEHDDVDKKSYLQYAFWNIR